MTLRARWLLLLLGATTFGLMEAAQVFITTAAANRGIPWTQAVASTMPSWYLLALLVPAVLWVARRFPIERARLGSALAVHVPAAVVFAGLHIVLTALVGAGLMGRGGESLSDVVLRLLFFYFVIDFAFYWAVVGAFYAFEYHGRLRDRERATAELELKTTRLEASLATANLQALKMQLHPHFLFNTLNAISALVHRDASAADRMIARLGELLRLSLENEGTQEVPLERELEFLEPYIEIEKARLGERLTVEIDVEAGTRDALVPHMVLQPLVENSVRHGIAPRSVPGRIEIRARREGEAVLITVRDNGPGLPAEERPGRNGGVGLRNTRARLEQLYGEQQRFELENAPEGGLLVTLALPYRSESLPPAARAAAGGVP